MNHVSLRRLATSLTCAALLSACGGSGENTAVLQVEPLQTKALRLHWSGVTGADALRLLEDPDGPDGPEPLTQMAVLDGAARSHIHPVYLPDHLNAQFVLEACVAGRCAAVAHATVSGDLAAAVGRVPGQPGTFMGFAVSLSADGRTLAVSTLANDDAIGTPDAALASGAVHVFARESTTHWRQQARLKAANADETDAFGQSIALSGDGDTLVVGAPGEDALASASTPSADNSLADSGAVYVYRRSGDTWALQAYLKAPGALADEAFGNSVALSGDGLTLLASAPGFGNAVGTVHVFRQGGNAWLHDAALMATHPEPDAGFGLALAISRDGQRLAVGAPQEDGSGVGVNPVGGDGGAPESGAVYVFERAHIAWSAPTYLKASNARPGDGFGLALDMSSDGDLLAVGAPFESSDAQGMPGPASEGSGAVYLFGKPSAAGPWTQSETLKASRVGPRHALGFCVALSGDGHRLVATAPGQDSPGAGLGGDEQVGSDQAFGAGFQWRQSGTTWRRGPLIQSPGPQPDAGFGLTCAMAGDGQTLAIGAMETSSSPASSSNGGSDFSGEVLLY